METAPAGRTRAEALFALSRIAWVKPGGALGPLDYLRRALDDAGEDRQLSGMIQAKLGMYSEGDQPRALEHSEAAAALLDEDADPGLLAYTLLTLLFFGAQTGRGIDEGLLQRALELERRAGRDAREELARPDLVPVHGRARGGTRPAPARGRVVPRPGRGDLGRREARAHRARGVQGRQLAARA